MPWGISRRFHRLSPWNGQVAHALRTLAPVAINRTRKFNHAAPRLACVKPAASVHPEPGSNSSLYNFSIKKFYDAPARLGRASELVLLSLFEALYNIDLTDLVWTTWLKGIDKFNNLEFPPYITYGACTTISVYENLSKNDFFFCARKPTPPVSRSRSRFASAKV